MTKKGEPRAPGFTQERFDAICDLIADGKSLREICELQGMPDRKTFNGWRKRTAELQAQYDQAYRDYEDSVLQDIVYIADTEKDASIAKNRMDARKWELKIRNRKKYGDSITHSGDPDAPVQLFLSDSDVKL
ncbi:hypothetical protein [Paraburkholderia sp. HD33-4]|uniref:terminase small subunit-like protein n=1 Tax=Paraburkholderia sp. HD33-4 TaxID=2883242 RepID=UPI001F28815C|nr:hypothetical protein [Paraburkholderia sp. HD33-4]